MTTLAWPTLSRSAPASVEWTLQANTQVFESPLTRSVATLEIPGARWAVKFTLANLQESDTRLLQAFMYRLRGRAGRFTLHNFLRATPSGVATGTPVVYGASQTGASLVTAGWTPSTTGILKAGDFWSVNGELKMLVEDAASDGSGHATLVFEPPLRESPADAAALTVGLATATFRVAGDDMPVVSNPGRISDITIDAVEAWA